MKMLLAASSTNSGFSLSRSNGTMAFYRSIRFGDRANIYGINGLRDAVRCDR
jgi:hypothetical protein